MATRLGSRRPQGARLRCDALEPRETPAATTVLDFGTGFTPLRLTGGLSAGYDTGELLLTTGPYQRIAVFAPTRVNVRAFHTSFVFRQDGGPGPIGDGFTFALAASNAPFFGTAGGGLGYQGLTDSVAIKFDLVDNAGEGTDSVGVYANGAAPTTPAVTLAGTGIDLHAGHPLRADLAYDGVNLNLTLTDTTAPAHTWTHSFAVNVPAEIGSETAYAGFTAGTGALFARQAIESWTYAEDTPAPAANDPPVFTTPARVILESPTEVTLGGGATDDGGAQNLTYTWTVASTPGGAAPQVSPITSPDYPAAARVTLDKIGAYTFVLTARDAQGLISTSPVTYVLAPKVTTLDVGPQAATIQAGGTAKFVATPLDQFGRPMQLPGRVSWQVVFGLGTIDQAGLYTAPAGQTGPAEIRAVVPTGPPLIAGYAAITVVPAGPAAGQSVDFGTGFAGSNLVQNGSARVADSRLQLTKAAYQAGSAYYPFPVDVRGFTTSFRFQVGDAPFGRYGDGLTFVLQNADMTAVGGAGGGLGYQGIRRSVAVKFDLVDNAGEGSDSVGVFTNGAAPTTPADRLPDGQFDAIHLNSGRAFDVTLSYAGGTLLLDLRDSVTGREFTRTYAVDIPAAVGGTNAFAGFTAGTGELFAPIDVASWTYKATVDGTGNAAPLILRLPGSESYHVFGTSVPLSALAADDAGEANLTYTWEVLSAPAGAAPVRFSSNGTNAAKNSTATFDRTGTYQYQLVVTDAQGSATRSPVLEFQVWPTLGAFNLTPSAPTVMNGAAVLLTVQPLDQFGDKLEISPGPWRLSTDGPGFIDGGNRYHAPQVGTGPVTVRVSNGTITGTATVLVVDRPSETVVDYAGGFDTSPGLVLNGSAVRDGGALQFLRATPNSAGSAFTTTPVTVTGFATHFDITMAQFPGAGLGLPYGMAFVLQGAGPTALGAAGSGVGYRGIPNSVALVFGPSNSIGVAVNGADPSQTVTLDGGGFPGLGVRSSIPVDLRYDGATLTVTLAGGLFTHQFPVDIPGVLGTGTAYAGFTAGGEAAADSWSQIVYLWSYRAMPPGAPNRPPVVIRPAWAFPESLTMRQAALRARAEDDGGPGNLRMRWEWVPQPAQPTPHMTGAGERGIVSFDQPGAYTFRFLATDAQGLTATSDVTYVVP
jgi:hypothetical protein